MRSNQQFGRKGITQHPNDIRRPNRGVKSMWRQEDNKYRKAVRQRRREKLARREAHEAMLAEKVS